MEYSFNITIVGNGKDVDAAFLDALESLKNNPSDAISEEVIYVKKPKKKNIPEA